MGHANAYYEGLKREKERNKSDPTKEVSQAQKEEVMYDVEVMMLRFGDSKFPTKKRKWAGLDFTPNDPILPDHQGTEPFVIKGSVGKTLIHIIYVDNGSSVNIIYSHCSSKLRVDDLLG